MDIMKNVVVHFNADHPTNKVHSDGLAILSGDAPVWKYCDLLHKCIADGAAVVAIAHGIDPTTKNICNAVIAYSNDPEYSVGKTLGDANKARDEKLRADPMYYRSHEYEYSVKEYQKKDEIQDEFSKMFHKYLWSQDWHRFLTPVRKIVEYQEKLLRESTSARRDY